MSVAWPAALLLLTALRLAVAALTPLSADEAYYWVWSRALAPGYLDHPPMVAVWIRVGTWLAGDGAFGIRLLSPVSALAGTVLLARAAGSLFPGRNAGVPAAALLNATLLLGVGSVTQTPDTPLILFWTGAIWALAQVLRTGRGWWWCVVGVLAGGALLSKYTALLLGVGLVLWLLLVPVGRAWLRTPWPWAGGVIAGLAFAPVLIWNAGHGWVSFVKQGGRTGDWMPARAATYIAELVGSQVGLATPVVLVLFGAGSWAALRGARRLDPAWTLLACLIWPGMLVFVQHAVGDRVQANWPAILYPACAIAAGAIGWRWRLAAGVGLAMTVAVYLQATAAWLPLPRRADVTLIRLGGWDGLAKQVEAASQDAAWIAVEEYGLASQLAWRLPASQVVGVETRWALFPLPSGAPVLAAGHGLLVQSVRRSEPPSDRLWQDIKEIGEAHRARAGVEAETYRLYRATVRPGAAASALLPHP